jgi:hypothetical protein
MMNTHPTSGNQSARPPGPSRRPSFLAWLETQLQSAGNRLFRADDALAAAFGWETSVGRWGLSRTFRDRRFEERAPSTETQVAQR